MPSPSASVDRARRALGNRLRELRQDARLSGRGLAELAGWHSSKVSKIEYGKQSPTEDDIRAWCASCGVAGETANLIASLRSIDEMYVEWKRMERTGLRRLQEAAVPLYERTRQFRIYEPALIPGLLQTPEYATALMGAVIAFRGIPDDTVEAVAVRIERQKVIRSGAVRFAVVLEEAALHNRMGGVDVMVGQLRHLLTIGSLPNVSLGIVPADTDRVMWPTSGFWIFDGSRVLIETTSAELAVTQPREIEIYAKAFTELSAIAVSGARARTLIMSAISGLHEDDSGEQTEAHAWN